MSDPLPPFVTLPTDDEIQEFARDLAWLREYVKEVQRA